MTNDHEEKQSWVFDWWNVLSTTAWVILSFYSELARMMLLYFWFPLIAGMTIGTLLQSFLAFLLHGPNRDHWNYQEIIIPWPSQAVVRVPILGIMVVAVVYGCVLKAPESVQRVAVIALLLGSAVLGVKMVRHLYLWNKYLRRKRAPR